MSTTDQSPARARAMTSGPTGRVHSLPCRPRGPRRPGCARQDQGLRHNGEPNASSQPEVTVPLKTVVRKRRSGATRGAARLPPPPPPPPRGQGGDADQGVEEPGEFGGRVGGQAAVHRAGLDDGDWARSASGSARPGSAGQRPLGAGLLERGSPPHRVEVGAGSSARSRPSSSSIRASGTGGLGVDDHAGVDRLAALDPGTTRIRAYSKTSARHGGSPPARAARA